MTRPGEVMQAMGELIVERDALRGVVSELLREKDWTEQGIQEYLASFAPQPSEPAVLSPDETEWRCADCGVSLPSPWNYCHAGELGRCLPAPQPEGAKG